MSTSPTSILDAQQHQTSPLPQSTNKRHCNKQSQEKIQKEFQQQIYATLRQFYPDFDLGKCLICKRNLESLYFAGRLKRHLRTKRCLGTYNSALLILHKKNAEEFFNHVCDYFYEQCQTNVKKTPETKINAVSEQKSDNPQGPSSSQQVKKVKKVKHNRKNESSVDKELNDFKEKQNQLLAQLVQNTNAMTALINNKKRKIVD